MKASGLQILALVTGAFGESGGIAQYNRDLLSALAKSEYVESVDILPRQGWTSSALPQKLLQREPATGKLAYVVQAYRLARQKDLGLIFCGHINLLPLANWLARKLDAPVWLQIHGIDACCQPKRIKQEHFKQVMMVTAVSRYTCQRFQAWANLAPHRVKVLPNTVGTPAERLPVNDLAVRLGVEGKKILLAVGRLAASEGYKGQDRVICCLPVLREQTPIVYLIAGDGDDRPRLQALAKERGVVDEVVFLGQVSDDELDALYRLADLFVMPSTGEGFGIVFLEAMAWGTPALGLNGDGSSDPLQDGRLGMAVEPSILCLAIEEALARPPQPELAARVQQIFGRQNFARHIESLIAPFWSTAAAGVH